MNKFTRKDVERVVDYFVFNGEDFSALDVRDELRNDNLYAIQGDVAPEVHDYMNTRINVDNIAYDSDNTSGYIVYSPDVVDEDEDDDDYDDDDFFSELVNMSSDTTKVVATQTLQFTMDTDGEMTVQKVEHSWVNPIGKTLQFKYHGGSNPGSVRECVILRCEETKLVAEITSNDVSFVLGADNIRNFSYINMSDTVIL